MRGRKCVYCRSYGMCRLGDGRVKCRNCRRVYSLRKLRRDLEVLRYFSLELSANRAARELEMSYKTVRDRYMFFREKIADYSLENFRKLSGELEIDETYFGGKRKGKRGRGAHNKVIVFGTRETAKLFLRAAT